VDGIWTDGSVPLDARFPLALINEPGPGPMLLVSQINTPYYYLRKNLFKRDICRRCDHATNKVRHQM
jgi:hypothetical protein